MEQEYVSELGEDFARRVCTEFQKLGARGSSVFVAIGDTADE